MIPVTVLIPTSPIPARPDTAIIEATVASVRAHLPDAPIVVMVDGPPGDDGYLEYRRRVVELCARVWWPALPVLHPKHAHQYRMTRAALDLVDTPLVLFVEHDTPLLDRPIPWEGLAAAVGSGAVDLVRLHHEAAVLDPHRHLMLDDGPAEIAGVPLWRTIQWSQRPHLASTAFYRTVMAGSWWAPDDGMIEDRMHSVAQAAYADHGEAGWDQYRLAIFYPPGDVKRSDHLDGRAGAEKVVTVR